MLIWWSNTDMMSNMNVRPTRSLSRLGLVAVVLLALGGQVLAQLPPGGPPGSPAAAHRHAIEMQQQEKTDTAVGVLVMMDKEEIEMERKQTDAASNSPTAAPAIDPGVLAATPPPPAQLPPAALPGVIQPNMNPPGTSGTQTPPAPATPAAGNTAPAAPPAEQKGEAGRMVLGEKIDVLTLEDLQDKLQATPDMILTLSGHTYRMSLLGDFAKSLSTISAMSTQSPVAQSPGRQ